MTQADCIIRVVRGTCDTAASTQQFTSSGIGQVKAAIFIVTRATADNSETADAVCSVGFTAYDSSGSPFISSQESSFSYSEDNQATTDSGHNQSTSRLVRIIDPTGTGGTYLAEASFSQWVTDGIEITWDTNAPSAYKITVILFGGSGVQATTVHNASCPATVGSSTTHTVGFPPHVIFTMKTAAGRELWANWGISDGTTNAGVFYISDHGTANGNERSFCFFDVVYQTIALDVPPSPDIAGSGIKLTNFTSTSFDATCTGAAAANDVTCLVLNLGSAGFAVHTDTSPTSTGTEAKTWPGHRTGFLMVGMSLATAATGFLDGSGMLGATDQQTSGSHGVRGDHGTANSETGSRTDAKVVNLGNGADSSALVVADWVSAGASGYTLDWTTVSGTARRYWALSVEEYVATGTGAGVLPTLSGAAAGTEEFTGTGAGVLPRFQGAASGEIAIEGSGAGTLPLLEGAGAALLAFVGAGAGTLPLLVGAASGELRVTGAASGLLPLFVGSGAGQMIVGVGSGAGVLPLLLGSGSGLESMSGAAAGVLPLFTGAGSGALAFLGTSAGVLPLFLGAGAGVIFVNVTGVGAGILPLLIGSGSGSGRGLLGCEVELEGDYTAVALLLGDYSTQTVLSGSYVSTAELEGDYASQNDLEGDYDLVTELEGGVC